jgi:hypothetical protein
MRPPACFGLGVRRSVPGPVAEHKAVSVRVNDGDAPSVLVGVAGRHHGATGLHETIHGVDVERPADVQDEEVFFARGCGRLAFGVTNQFVVPGGVGPAKHSQCVPTLCVCLRAVKHVQAETFHPESLGAFEVAARTCDAEVTRRPPRSEDTYVQWVWSSCPHASRSCRARTWAAPADSWST